MWLTAVKTEDSKIRGKEINSNTKKCEKEWRNFCLMASSMKVKHWKYAIIEYDHRVLDTLKGDGSNPPLMDIQEKHIHEDTKGSC